MRYKKIVIKVGTSVLANPDGSINALYIEQIASQVGRLSDRGIDVVLVSSGAISAGLGILKVKSMPASLPELQATASIGQSELMRLYRDAFKKMGYCVAQILLTQDDFDHRQRYLNIKHTINALLSKGVVPIVNENDTVSTEEIKCGDNDRLSSLVADLIAAEALLILSNVDGLQDAKGNIITVVEDITEDLVKLAGKKCKFFTKGGMSTKLEAARIAVNSGIECFVANGTKPNIALDVLRKKGIFTYFTPKAKAKKAKKRWIAYSSKIKGRLVVDEGAKRALIANHKSLLSSGIVKHDGAFKAGDVVAIVDTNQKEFARGITNYSAKEISRIKGLKSREIQKALGHKEYDEVVHRDNLVIL